MTSLEKEELKKLLIYLDLKFLSEKYGENLSSEGSKALFEIEFYTPAFQRDDYRRHLISKIFNLIEAQEEEEVISNADK